MKDIKLEEIKNQVAYENNWRDWDDAPDIRQLQMWPEVNRRHARECCKATQEKCAEDVKPILSATAFSIVKPRIIHESNICIL